MSVRHRLIHCVGALMLVVVYLLPAHSSAAPAAKLYVGHAARLTLQIPSDWTVDPTGRYDYLGTDGFVASQPVTGRTLDEACSELAASPRFDGAAIVVPATWSGQAACRIDGRIEGADVAAVVVAHPHHFENFGERFAYAAVIADHGDLDAIVATLDFSPDRVTPEAYLTGVLDLVEARAYWADQVDWPLTRREMLASIDGLPTVEMAQGALRAIVQKLHAAGDNHSFVLLPDQRNALDEASGFGLLVGGRQILVVYPNGPADRAEVRVGDVIDAVDGRPFLPIPYPIDPAMPTATDPATRWGTAVRLTLRRPGALAPIAVPIEQGPYGRYIPPTGRRLPGDIGYVAVPGFTTPGQETAYATAANRVVASVDQTPTCGWVLDLRLDTGGSYSPMITGVGPILGDGTFVGWRWPDDRQSWVSYEEGRISDDGIEVSNYLAQQTTYQLQRPDPPVAVLTSPTTASSGEVATLAFVGRPGARLFGEPTAGRTTANQSYSLFDGSSLALAGSAMTDRTGATHLAGVEPDQRVAIDWTAYGTAHDPVLAAALDWLDRQPACAKAPSATPETPHAGTPALTVTGRSSMRPDVGGTPR